MVAGTCHFFMVTLFEKMRNYGYTISTKWESTRNYGNTFCDKKKFGIIICMNSKQCGESRNVVDYNTPFNFVALHYSCQ